jgi:peptidoglycan/xylan/chitin deacetylase (PgdA/CDA1 family)
MKYSVVARRLIHHPLIVVPSLVIVLALAWQQYTTAGRNLNLPTQDRNLLAANVGQQSANSPLAGWQVSRSGDATYTVDRQSGFVTDKAIKTTVSNYKSGDVTVTSPKVSVTANQTYLFKDYYTSDMQFVLLARYHYDDGTSQLIHLKTYLAQKDGWSTTSHAFTTDKITAVQFIYKLTNTGTLSIDGMYLEPKQDVFIPKQPQAGKNAIPNSELVSKSDNMPDEWTTYRAGNNTAAFSSLQDDKGTYVKTTVRNFKNGEAKWQYTPQPVHAHQRYQFSAQYLSDAQAKVIAEYVLENGKHQFETIANLPAAGEWTDVTYSIEVPKGATSLVVSIVLHGNGSLASRGYTLTDSTKPGAASWRRPLVSITFDDGWYSAYNNALPILNRYGYKGTFYINPSSIETPKFMTAAELATLHDTHHEIATRGYSYADMTTLSPDALDTQLRQGQTYLASAGFPTVHFATPYGKSDAEVQWFARKYFATMRSVDSGINTRQNFDQYNLKAFFLKNDTSLETITTALEEARQAGGWLIFVYHNVGFSQNEDLSLKVESGTMTTETFAEQISLVQKSGIPVLPVGDAYNEIKNQ